MRTITIPDSILEKKYRKDITILVDMDDVLTDLITPWINMINKKYNINRSISSVTEWHLNNIFKKEINNGLFTRDDIYNILYEHELWDNVKPIKDAQKSLKYLYDAGYNVIICTATDYKIAQYKFDNCLLKYFPFINKKDIIITDRKELVRGDILIDDSADNILKFPGYGILFDKPHNKKLLTDNYNNKIRAKDWVDIMSIIHTLSLGIEEREVL